MKVSQFLIAILCICVAVVSAKDNEDDDGFFYFTDDNDWSESSILPIACVESSDGDSVVYSMYQSNNNQCARRSIGTYKAPIATFVRAYTRQMQIDAERKGQEYEIDDEAAEFLQCQQYYYNNNLFYLKVGCRSNGQGFQIHGYTDMYCTAQSSSMNYNLGVDVSSLRVNFGTCKKCVNTSSYGYNNGNNNNNNNANRYYGNNGGNGNNYYGGNGGGGAYYVMSMHESMLCSAANYYKETCNGSCKKAAKRAAKNNSSTSRMSYSEGFSPIGKFFLWVLSLSSIFFLLAGLAQRKKMSKQDAVIEEAAIKSAGVDKKFIPRIFVALILFVVLLILFRKKVLTWFFLVAINVALLSYWMHLKNKAEQHAVAEGGFQMYSEGATPA